MIGRVQELNSFINFVIERSDLFSSPVLHKFFDSALPDTKVGEIINKYSIKNYKLIAERMLELYPEFKDVF